MSKQGLTASHLKAIAAAKAGSDAKFRAEFLANPHAAFESWFGTALPPQIKLRAIEEGADEYVVVIPHNAAAGKDGELSDDDLEAVAGGSKSGASDFFGTLGSGLGVVAALPVLMPAHDLGGQDGKDWANKAGDDIVSSCT